MAGRPGRPRRHTEGSDAPPARFKPGQGNIAFSVIWSGTPVSGRLLAFW